MRSVVDITVFIALLFVAFPALAGPPFLTDDPEPVEYKHWEIYLASMSEEQHGGVSMTAPHVDVNYGCSCLSGFRKVGGHG